MTITITSIFFKYYIIRILLRKVVYLHISNLLHLPIKIILTLSIAVFKFISIKSK